MMHSFALSNSLPSYTLLTHPSFHADQADDLRLLERARRLDAEALSLIHRQYYDPLFRYVAFRVADRETAEDLTSDVFVRLVDALHSGAAPQQSLRGWLFGVAFRVVQDHYRRGYRAPEVALDDEFEAPGHDLDEVLDEEAFRARLAEELGQLTDEQQSVLAMRFGAGLPIRRVAEALGKTEGAVKQLQARAVATLGRRLMRQAVE